MFLLLGAIKGLTFKLDGHKNPLHTLHSAKRDFYWYCQIGQIKKSQYLDTFKNKVSAIESYGRDIGTDQ